MPSKPSDTRRWLLDIRHNIHLADKFIAGLDCDRFVDDAQALYAATRCLEIISEASRRLPSELKARLPMIPWSQVAAAGNV
jgi:uncharacterized protein with HEPN domain